MLCSQYILYIVLCCVEHSLKAFLVLYAKIDYYTVLRAFLELVSFSLTSMHFAAFATSFVSLTVNVVSPSFFPLSLKDNI